MPRIFISYSRKGQEVAEALAKDFHALRQTVWLDEELTGGQAWWDEILRQIQECDLFVLAVDLDSLRSAACQRELEYAQKLHKHILPVKVSDRVSERLFPPELVKIEYVSYRQDRDSVIRLANALSTVTAAPPLPDPLPEPPEVPTSYLGNLAAHVDNPSILTSQEQKNLVFDLKKSLEDPETEQDARTLLERLRKRHELLASVRDDIDDLLGSSFLGKTGAGVVTTPLSPQNRQKDESSKWTGPDATEIRPPETFKKTQSAPISPFGDVPRPQPPPIPPPRPPSQLTQDIPNHLLWAIFAIFFCWPLGIVSVVSASQVNKRIAAGDFAGALVSSRKAKTFAVIATVVWLAALVLAVVGSALSH
jgi:hypothetical protein